jgi:hypothetical protein
MPLGAALRDAWHACKSDSGSKSVFSSALPLIFLFGVDERFIASWFKCWQRHCESGPLTWSASVP